MAAAAGSIAATTLAIFLLLSPFAVAAQEDTTAGDALIDAITSHCCLHKFYGGLQLSRIDATLRDRVNQGPITLFAASDDALVQTSPRDAELHNCLSTGQGPLDILSQIMLYHIVTDGNLTAAEVAKKTQLTSASGMPIDVKVVNGIVLLEGYAPITGPDALKTPNATVHIIGELLFPETILSAIEELCPAGETSTSPPIPGV